MTWRATAAATMVGLLWAAPAAAGRSAELAISATVVHAARVRADGASGRVEASAGSRHAPRPAVVIAAPAGAGPGVAVVLPDGAPPALRLADRR